MADQVELRCRCGEVRGLVTASLATGGEPRGLLLRRLPGVCPPARPCRSARSARRQRHRPACAGLADVSAGTASDRRTAAGAEGPVPMVRELLQHPGRQHADAGHSLCGVVAQAFDLTATVFGPPTGAILGKYAIGAPPAGSTGLNLPLLLRAIGKVLGWRLRGKAWPHPFFAQGQRRAGLSGDRTVAGTARRVASVVRTACRGFDFVGRISEA